MKLLSVIWLAAVLPVAAASPQIVLQDNRVVVKGAGGVKADLAVYVGSAAPDAPPVLGTIRVTGNDLVFEPRFPLRAGVRYRAVLRMKPPVEAWLEIPPAPARPATRVERVFPSRDRLPQNQLKMYLHFSAPMSRGEAYRRISLLDAAGRKVTLPFLELEQELWDSSGRRFTLLFDPGRIKRGLVPHREEGPPLVPNGRYALVIDPAWPDAEGRDLAAPFRKEFTVTEADRTPLDPRNWKITIPRAGSIDSLLVSFPEPLDRAMLDHALAVIDEAGADIAGNVAVEREETSWRFTPATAWKAGTFKLEFDRNLEDLAGNRVGRPFDVDVFERVSELVERQTGNLTFQVR